MHLACFIFASLLSRPGTQASLFVALLTLCMKLLAPFYDFVEEMKSVIIEKRSRVESSPWS